MAVTELSRHHSTRYCLFYIDTFDDIKFLPTSKESGKGELSQSSPCCAGSVAKDMTGNQYVLNGHDEWVVFKSSSPSGSGIDIEIATNDEVNNMLDDVFSSSL